MSQIKPNKPNKSNKPNLDNITLYELENILFYYFDNAHPIDSNGFIIRIGDILENSQNRRRSYFVNFPEMTNLNNELISKLHNEIISNFVSYGSENIIPNNDLNYQFTIISIDPIKVSTLFDTVKITYGGVNVNQEDLIRTMSMDIINFMYKHLIEYYMDQHYPNIDIDDKEQLDIFNDIFDNLDIDEICLLYPMVEVYVGINFISKDKQITQNLLSLLPQTCEIYLNGIIHSNYKIIDIIDAIRECLNSDDPNEIFTYSKDDIVFKFINANSMEKIKKSDIGTFCLITDPKI